MGKTIDMFGRLKFWLPQNYSLAKTYAASRESKIERVIDASFWLCGEFYAENTQRYFCEMS